MRLDGEENAMLHGEQGTALRLAMEHQLAVGRFFGADDMVPVTQAHIMADTESLGLAGVQWLEQLADASGAVRVPTITDPRGTDFAHAKELGQADWMVELERRAIDAFTRLGVAMTDTCINYQTVLPALRGEHVAYGDTGVVIYTNSVLGARSNYEGGPSALAAALTGRTPRYGFHLDVNRQATVRFRVTHTPSTLDEWGALGAVIGRQAGSYDAVPVIEGLEATPGSDEIKHFGAAMASFGSIALFHIVGVTPEAPTLQSVGGQRLSTVHTVSEREMASFRRSYADGDTSVDVVVFSAPQLSLYELRKLAALTQGLTFRIPLLVTTSPQVKPDADRFGYTQAIESAGGTVLQGMCFYQSYAREIAKARGWRRLASNSAKLVNILGGYGYQTRLASMEQCVQAAVTGELA